MMQGYFSLMECSVGLEIKVFRGFISSSAVVWL